MCYCVCVCAYVRVCESVNEYHNEVSIAAHAPVQPGEQFVVSACVCVVL